MPKDITRRSGAQFSKLHHSFPVELYEETRWYACRTRARAEKKVDELLGRAGFETHLPLVVRERQWADRRKLVAFPLFPGYTFARFDLTRYLDVLTTCSLLAFLTIPAWPVSERVVSTPPHTIRAPERV